MCQGGFEGHPQDLDLTLLTTLISLNRTSLVSEVEEGYLRDLSAHSSHDKAMISAVHTKDGLVERQRHWRCLSGGAKKSGFAGRAAGTCKRGLVGARGFGPRPGVFADGRT